MISVLFAWPPTAICDYNAGKVAFMRFAGIEKMVFNMKLT